MDAVNDDPFERLRVAFVPTSRVRTATDRINSLMRRGLRADSADCVAFVGPSGMGKSTILRRLRDRHPPFLRGRQLIRPVCLVRAPTSTGNGSLLTMTLHALGDPRPGSGEPTVRELRVIGHLRSQEVKLLCFDEVNHLIDSDSDRIGYKAANVIKSIMLERVCPVVLTGVTHARRVLDTNPQLSGRSRALIEMRPFDWRVDADRIEFIAFLGLVERQMGLPEPSHLNHPETAHRIHHVSRGLPGHAVHLIWFALEEREDDGNRTPCITGKQLTDAADRLLLREPTRRTNAFRVAPPDAYAPAPMYEALKEPRGKGRNLWEQPDDAI